VDHGSDRDLVRILPAVKFLPVPQRQSDFPLSKVRNGHKDIREMLDLAIWFLALSATTALRQSSSGSDMYVVRGYM
jgi:hypothetical protein